MERHRPFGAVRHRVRQEEHLDLRLCEGPAVNLSEQPDETVEQNGRQGHGASHVGNEAEGGPERVEGWTRCLGCGVDGANGVQG